MRERQRLYGILTAIVLAAGLTFGAPNPSRAQETGDIPSTATVEEQYREGAEAIADDEYEKAVRILEPLAGKDHVPALLALGSLYRHETDALNDDEKAFEYFKKAAALGSDEARFVVAASYDLGHGVIEDREKARILYKELVDCGMIAASFAFGNSYLDHPPATPAELEKAERQLRIAADKGHLEAILSLGTLLTFKLDELVEGWRWIVIAAQNNQVDAVRLLQRFEKDSAHHNPIKNAKRYAERWQGPEPLPLEQLTQCQNS